MDKITKSTIIDLGAERQGPCVSLYMPVVSAGPQVRQNPIRLSNLLRGARERLAETADSKELLSLLEQAEETLADKSADPKGQPGDGFALFAAPDLVRTLNVPFPVEEQVTIGRRLITRPLLPALGGGADFYVIALSRNSAELFHASSGDIEEVDVEGMPRGLIDLEKYEDPEKSVQTHPSGYSQRGFHGHGTHKDSALEHLEEEYVRDVATAVAQELKDSDAPLVVSAAEEILALYRKHNTYPHVLDDAIEGSPDRTEAERLREEGREIIRASMGAARKQAVLRYADLSSTDRTTDDAEEVVRMAIQGRVQELFVAEEAEWWGRIKEDMSGVISSSSQGPDDDDIIDFAAVTALGYGGTVCLLPLDSMPRQLGGGPVSGGPLAAILRE
ncbi:MAG: hypothetical protein WD848_12885 [Dehalococcoidia bacterium]